MKTLVAIAILAVSVVSHAEDKLPVSAPTTISIGYVTSDDAAIAALSYAYTASTAIEYAGAVYKRDGLYHFTQPASSAGEDSFKVTIAGIRKSELVALYHTHPGSQTYESEVFSPGDIDIAKTMGVISYIGVIPSMTVRKFNPKYPHTRMFSVQAPLLRIADGQQVGVISSLMATNIAL